MKKKEIRESLVTELRKKFPTAELTGNISFYDAGTLSNGARCVEIQLSEEAAGSSESKTINMQDDAAAFEAVSLILYVHLGYHIKLSINTYPTWQQLQSKLDLQRKTGKKTANFGHGYRFLYRAMKFSEQYKAWFSLSPQLTALVDDFRQFLTKEHFTNNWPDAEATNLSETDREVSEAFIESLFADVEHHSATLKRLVKNRTGIEIPSEQKIFRQLPVGLFIDKKYEKNRIFTGKKSAIDLWTVADDQVLLFELKYENDMVGIVTELMFYANFVMDMYVKKELFTPREDFDKRAKLHRGYDHLINRQSAFRGICAFLLLDPQSQHPLINEKVIAEMCNADPSIVYYQLGYHYEMSITEG